MSFFKINILKDLSNIKKIMKSYNKLPDHNYILYIVSTLLSFLLWFLVGYFLEDFSFFESLIMSLITNLLSGCLMIPLLACLLSEFLSDRVEKIGLKSNSNVIKPFYFMKDINKLDKEIKLKSSFVKKIISQLEHKKKYSDLELTLLIIKEKIKSVENDFLLINNIKIINEIKNNFSKEDYSQLILFYYEELLKEIKSEDFEENKLKLTENVFNLDIKSEEKKKILFLFEKKCEKEMEIDSDEDLILMSYKKINNLANVKDIAINKKNVIIKEV